MKKGFHVLNMALLRSYKGWKYHIADKNGRLYLCPCGYDLALKFQLGITKVRSTNLSFPRDNEWSYSLHFERFVNNTEQTRCRRRL